MNLNIKKENKYEIWAKCCFHDDKHASLLISKTGEFAGYFKCFGCGKFGKADSLGIDTANWTTTCKSSPAPIDWIKTNNLFRDNLKHRGGKNLIWEFTKKWVVKSSILEELQCGYTGSCFTFPMYNHKFEITGIQRYFENNDKKVIGGSTVGVFASSCLDYNKEKLYITEGLSDTAVALDLGLPTIGKYNAASCEDIVLNIVKDCDKLRRITIIADNDKIGIKSVNKLQKILNKNTTGIYIRIFIPSVGNDLRELRDIKGNEFVSNSLR